MYELVVGVSIWPQYSPVYDLISDLLYLPLKILANKTVINLSLV
jgi:hypothetical protein